MTVTRTRRGAPLHADDGGALGGNGGADLGKLRLTGDRGTSGGSGIVGGNRGYPF